MRQATNNQDVQRTLDRKIREAESSISYFQETLTQLQSKKTQIERGGGSAGSGGSSGGGKLTPSGRPSDDRYGTGDPSRQPGAGRKYPSCYMLNVQLEVSLLMWY